jgi:hypothetical protein
MLKLRKGPPPAARVALGEGAFIMIRPASYGEILIAAGEVAERMSGLVAAGTIAAEIGPLLGPEFNFDQLENADLDGLSRRLALISLTMRCQQGWGGIGDTDGNAIAEPTEELIAMLTRDTIVASKLQAAIEAPWHIALPDEGEVYDGK